MSETERKGTMVRKTYRCKDCGHEWRPRKIHTRQCPKCWRFNITLINLGEKIEELHCVKCGHTWLPRIDNPALCPSCQTPYWKKGSRDSSGKIIH